MSCAEFEPMIALFVENDLPDAEARALESHLESCESCREFAAGMRESQAALKGLRAEFVEDPVFAEVRGEVLDEVSRPPKVVAWPRYAIAAMLIAGLAAGLLWKTRSGAPIDLPRAASVVPPPAMPVTMSPEPKPAVRRHGRRRQPAPRFKSEPLVVKMMTDDPQVVIYWLVDQNGG